jgi:hypothetical protein
MHRLIHLHHDESGPQYHASFVVYITHLVRAEFVNDETLPALVKLVARDEILKRSCNKDSINSDEVFGIKINCDHLKTAVVVAIQESFSPKPVHIG